MLTFVRYQAISHWFTFALVIRGEASLTVSEAVTRGGTCIRRILCWR